MPVYGYRRDLEGAGEGIEATRALGAQDVAIAGACAAHRLELSAVYTERGAGSGQWRALLRDVIEARDGGHPVTVVVASLGAIAPRARERIVRALQLHASGARILLGSGDDLETAMLEAWHGRDGSDRHRERVLEGMRRLAVRGRALGRAPYGYRVEGHRLAVDEDEAAVVREVVRLYLDEELGVRRIAALLNDRGLATRQGRPWSATAVRDILRNPTYLGTYRRLGVIVANAHEPILGRRDFDEVQRRMSARRTAPAEQHRREYLLSGLARCGYCGNRLIGVRRPGVDGELVYYQCESATNHGRCGYHTRRAEALEHEVRVRLGDGMTEVGERPAASPGGPPPPSVAARERLEARRRGLQRQLDRGLERWAAGEWSFQRFCAEAGPRALADLEAEAELDALTRLADSPPLPPGEIRRRLVDEWDALPFEERRALLQQLIAEIVVTDEAVRLELAAR